jgi:hypothetical protein
VILKTGNIFQESLAENVRASSNSCTVTALHWEQTDRFKYHILDFIVLPLYVSTKRPVFEKTNEEG